MQPTDSSTNKNNTEVKDEATGATEVLFKKPKRCRQPVEVQRIRQSLDESRAS